MIKRLFKAGLIALGLIFWISFVGSMWMTTGFVGGFVGLFYLSGMIAIPLGVLYGCIYHPI